MNKIKAAALKTKNHVVANKFAYAATALAIAAIALQQRNRIGFEKFLIEKGIDPTEFYTPEYFEELNA